MASLLKKVESWHCQFTYARQRRTGVIGPVEEGEAKAIKPRVEHLLKRIKQRLLDVPVGMDIVTFIQFDGKPPDTQFLPASKETPYCEFRDSFLKSFGHGALEDNTLYTAKIHLKHVGRTLGERFPINALTLADLQQHIDRR